LLTFFSHDHATSLIGALHAVEPLWWLDRE
jgi:hypothetical protein